MFTSEYLRVNENDDQGQPEDNSGLELLDDIPTMLRWAEESLRQQGLSKGEYEENIPMVGPFTFFLAAQYLCRDRRC